VEHSNRPLVRLMLPIRATPAGCRKRKDERADVTTDGQVSLSNGTLQRKRTRIRVAGRSALMANGDEDKARDFTVIKKALQPVAT
jgi:hypothetical protein